MKRTKCKITVSKLLLRNRSADGFSLLTVSLSLFVLAALSVTATKNFFEPQLVLRSLSKQSQAEQYHDAAFARVSVLSVSSLYQDPDVENNLLDKPFEVKIDDYQRNFVFNNEEASLDVGLASVDLIMHVGKGLGLAPSDLKVLSEVYDRSSVKTHQFLIKNSSAIDVLRLPSILTTGSKERRIEIETVSKQLRDILGDKISAVNSSNYYYGTVEGLQISNWK